MSDSVRARLNLLVATAVAFAFGLGLASALDLTPLSIAADDRPAPTLVLGAPDGADVTMNGGFSDMLERVRPAVVTVWSYGERRVPGVRIPIEVPDDFDFPEEFDRDEDDEGADGPVDRRRRDRSDPEDDPLGVWSGSGFVISADGYVLTNNHVVQGATYVNVELADQRLFENVEVVGRDPQTDVALLKIDAEDLPVTPLGESEATRVGEWVLAIGSPGVGGGAGGPLETTVTAGIVSAKGRNIQILNQGGQVPLAIEDFIQTDAVINRGNSGGPLVNAAGEVIGINTAIASTTGVYAGYGFAVPIELAREVLDDLIDYGEVRRALIGVGINDVTSADARFYGLDRVAGAKVGTFSDIDGDGDPGDSPAFLAGLEIGDVIVGVEGRPVSGVSELQRRIRAFGPGETVDLDIVRRSTREREVAAITLIAADRGETPTVVRIERPAERFNAENPLEIEVTELTGGTRREYMIPDGVANGVVIVGGEARGPFGKLFNGSVPEGTVIKDFNGQAIATVADYERIASGLDPGEAVSFILEIDFTGGGGYSPVIQSLVLPQR
ncbi:MAG: trypsin-like peptidase domain-containing protein [Gemmatimonadota bacterium]|nr:trypsin-like peptidase domain-containing protein [Gemmatimonadota bacterium]